MQLVAIGMLETEVCSLKLTGIFFFLSNIFDSYSRHKKHRFDPWVQKILWRKAQQSIPVFLPRESLGQRSQAGYSP